MCELFKDRPIGILNLRSIGYYKVSYQKLIAMAEERFKLFQLYIGINAYFVYRVSTTMQWI